MIKQNAKNVYWTLPHQKRYFASSTIATDDLIIALSEDNMTVKDVYNLINYDKDAKKILKVFIDNGYENFIMKDFVTQNNRGIYRKKEGEHLILVERGNLKKIIDKELRNKEKKYVELELEI